MLLSYNSFLYVNHHCADFKNCNVWDVKKVEIKSTEYRNDFTSILRIYDHDGYNRSILHMNKYFRLNAYIGKIANAYF